MCFFLTVAVPIKHVEHIGEVFGRGFQTHANANPSVTAALPAGYAARLVTSGMCSCDLYARSEAGTRPDPATHLRRKYEKLGWSEAKIQRALTQTAARASKHVRPTVGLRDDVTERLGTLCRKAGSVAFLVHWYNGDVQTESLQLHQAKPCTCDVLPLRAKQLNEDEVVIAAIRLAD
jgi:hypothetical protein